MRIHPSTTAHITNSSDSLDQYLYPGLIEEIVEVLELSDPNLMVSVSTHTTHISILHTYVCTACVSTTPHTRQYTTYVRMYCGCIRTHHTHVSVLHMYCVCIRTHHTHVSVLHMYCVCIHNTTHSSVYYIRTYVLRVYPQHHTLVSILHTYVCTVGVSVHTPHTRQRTTYVLCVYPHTPHTRQRTTYVLCVYPQHHTLVSILHTYVCTVGVSTTPHTRQYTTYVRMYCGCIHNTTHTSAYYICTYVLWVYPQHHTHVSVLHMYFVYIYHMSLY